MKKLICLSLLLFLLTGCLSTGLASFEESSTGKETLPGEIDPAGEVPVDAGAADVASASGVVVTAYNPAEKGYTLRAVDPATGEPVPGRTPILVSEDREYVPQVAYSSDGSRLAAIESSGVSCEAFAGGSSCYPQAIAVRVLDPQSWQVVSSPLPSDGWAGAMSFSPAADRLAISYNHPSKSSVLVLGTSTGEILSTLTPGFRPEGVAFFQDGSQLLVYGTLTVEQPGVTAPGPLRLEAYSIPSGERLWARELSDVTSGSWCLESCDDEHGRQLYAIWMPAYVLSPDGTTFFILHADLDKFTRISLADGTREDVEIHEAASWFERLLAATAGVAQAKGGAQGADKLATISPDGTRLYLQSTEMDAELKEDGYWEPLDSVTDLQIIDARTGQILARTEASGYGYVLTTDGKYLFSTVWTDAGLETEVLSADDLSSVTGLLGWELIYSRDLDGKDVLLGRYDDGASTSLALVDPDDFQVVGSWKSIGIANWVPVP